MKQPVQTQREDLLSLRTERHPAQQPRRTIFPKGFTVRFRSKRSQGTIAMIQRHGHQPRTNLKLIQQGAELPPIKRSVAK